MRLAEPFDSRQAIDSGYRNALSEGVLRLQESGKLATLKLKWWKEKKGGGACQVRRFVPSWPTRGFFRLNAFGQKGSAGGGCTRLGNGKRRGRLLCSDRGLFHCNIIRVHQRSVGSAQAIEGE